MGVKKAVENRLQELCAERQLAVNGLAVSAGVTPSTVYSVLKSERKDIGIVTIKKLCDALDISLEEFFSAEVFRALEQEVE